LWKHDAKATYSTEVYRTIHLLLPIAARILLFDPARSSFPNTKQGRFLNKMEPYGILAFARESYFLDAKEINGK
jgi:hypothetical protein